MKSFMKKSLLLIAVLLTAVSFSIAAVTDTAELTLNGSVGDTVTVTVTDQTQVDPYDLSVDLAITQVATLDYTGNVAFTLTAESANGGSTSFIFAGETTGNTDTLEYSLYRDGSPWSGISESGPASATGVPIEISYTGDPLLTTDTYTDTITFTITGP